MTQSAPRLVRMAALALLSLVIACASHDANGNTGSERPRWALAIHGGAGVISKDLPADVREGYRQSLDAALGVGIDALERGAPALDVAEAVIRTLEDDPRFNAGRGAVYTAEATHELDASIMDGATLACGAVTGVTTVRHPISLARRVMEESRHVFFSGAGAEAFADGFPDLERVPNSFFDTERRREQLENALRPGAAPPPERSTVGCVVLDGSGNLVAATSTGGMTAKRFGRIGDSPIIGAGNYANNATCAISCTGTGEEFIRHGVARDIAARMEHGGVSLGEAARTVVHDVLAPGDGGIIGVSRDGEIALVFNSKGMFRGAADANGRREVAIWE